MEFQRAIQRLKAVMATITAAIAANAATAETTIDRLARVFALIASFADILAASADSHAASFALRAIDTSSALEASLRR